MAAIHSSNQTKQVVKTLTDWTLKEPEENTATPPHPPALPAQAGRDPRRGRPRRRRPHRAHRAERRRQRRAAPARRTTGRSQAVYRAVGYFGSPLVDIPFDDVAGVIPNREGRVVDVDGEHAARRLRHGLDQARPGRPDRPHQVATRRRPSGTCGEDVPRAARRSTPPPTATPRPSPSSCTAAASTSSRGRAGSSSTPTSARWASPTAASASSWSRATRWSPSPSAARLSPTRATSALSVVLTTASADVAGHCLESAIRTADVVARPAGSARDAAEELARALLARVAEHLRGRAALVHAALVQEADLVGDLARERPSRAWRRPWSARSCLSSASSERTSPTSSGSSALVTSSSSMTRGLGDERARDRDALLLAAGQLVGEGLRLVGQPDPVEHGQRLVLGLLAGDACAPAAGRA